ncbi:hypothetical protein BKA61DRAFT_661677 [Leptodontidium sp. MPI-SDFR-AT-0119]|nr:hypothetical protein BKA61DRAFT_661677 [Leptodontidium sp. MPI-SDFR-AT-0119]
MVRCLGTSQGSSGCPTSLSPEGQRLLRRRVPTDMDQDATCHYWTVKKDGSLVRHVAARDTQAHLQSVREREQERLRAEERSHQLRLDTGVQRFATTGPWIEWTHWPVPYKDATAGYSPPRYPTFITGKIRRLETAWATASRI